MSTTPICTSPVGRGRELATHARAAVGTPARAARQLTLRATASGWSMLDSGGAVVVRRQGAAGRRECLEFARALGVLSILT
jgi:hypothetical protein